jgi:hypothetical protein
MPFMKVCLYQQTIFILFDSDARGRQWAGPHAGWQLPAAWPIRRFPEVPASAAPARLAGQPATASESLQLCTVTGTAGDAVT